jgi:hypothetical protein
MSDRFFNRDRNRPYDEDYDELFDRDLETGYSMRDRNYGRGDTRGRGERDFGRQGSGNYGMGGRGQGHGMSRGYNRDYGQQGGYGQQQRGYGMQSGYGQQQRGYDMQGGYYQDDFDIDYEYDDEPMWMYEEEIWIIPGPFTGMGPEDYHRSDERIKEDINERLTQHGQIDARKVHVEVQDGEATLTGEVPDRHSKRMCEDVVYTVTGVKDCHNQLRIKERQERQQQYQQQQQQGQHQREGQRSRQGQER